MDEAGDHDDLAAQWQRVTEAIRADEPEGSNELYAALKGFRAFFERKLGAEEADDRYHDLVIALLHSIKNGSLKEPTRLTGYARATARNMVAERIKARMRVRQLELGDGWLAVKDGSPSAEAATIRKQAKAIARRILVAMPERDRNVLVRFYVDEDNAGHICADMDLSETQFRLIKSRAKARFAALVQQRMQSKRVRRTLVLKSA